MMKLDSSSSECNPTGIAHHAHTPTLDTRPLELHTRTPESSLSESSTGDHQPGLESTEELPGTDIATDTETTTTLSESSKTAVLTSERPTQKLNTSSSDINPTGIALLVQNHTLDTRPPELDTRTQESTPIDSSTGDHQYIHGDSSIRELLSTDSVTDTDSTSTTSEPLNNVEITLENLIHMLDTSSSEKNPTGIALHAHTSIRDTQPQELEATTQESILIES